MIVRWILKDVREDRWLFGLVGLWLGFQCLVTVAPATFGGAPYTHLPVMTVVAAIVAGRLVLADAPSRRRAYWKTLPVAWPQLLIAKTILLAAVVAVAATCHLLRILRVEVDASTAHLWLESALSHALLVSVTAATTALVRRGSACMAACLAVALSFLLWMFVGRPLVFTHLFHGEDASGVERYWMVTDGYRAALWIAVITGAGLLVWAFQLATRRRVQATMLAGGLACAGAALSLIPDDAAVAQAPDAPELAPRIEFYAPSWATNGVVPRLESLARFEASAPGTTYYLRSVLAHITLDDGRTYTRRSYFDERLDRSQMNMEVEEALGASGYLVGDWQPRVRRRTLGVPLLALEADDVIDPESIASLALDLDLDVFRVDAVPIAGPATAGGPVSQARIASGGGIPFARRWCKTLLGDDTTRDLHLPLAPSHGRYAFGKRKAPWLPEHVAYLADQQQFQTVEPSSQLMITIPLLALSPRCWTESGTIEIDVAEGPFSDAMWRETAELIALRWRYVGVTHAEVSVKDPENLRFPIRFVQPELGTSRPR